MLLSNFDKCADTEWESIPTTLLIELVLLMHSHTRSLAFTYPLTVYGSLVVEDTSTIKTGKHTEI